MTGGPGPDAHSPRCQCAGLFPKSVQCPSGTRSGPGPESRTALRGRVEGTLAVASVG